MKRLLGLLAALCLALPAGAGDPSAAAVLVRVGPAAGSGVVVACEGGRSLVLTNRHVVTHAAGRWTVEAGGVAHAVTHHALHPTEDLAVLVVAAELPAVEMARREPAEGQPVALVGYGWDGGGRPVRKAGAVVRSALGRFRSTIPCVSGDSGGGVFDGDGRLVSVNHGFEGTYEARGPMLGVRLARLRAYLRDRVGAQFPKFAARLRAESPDEPPLAAAPVTPVTPVTPLAPTGRRSVGDPTPYGPVVAVAPSGCYAVRVGGVLTWICPLNGQPIR